MPALSELQSPPAKIRKGANGERIIEKNQNMPDVPRAKVRTRIVPATNDPRKKLGRPPKNINKSLPGSSKQNVSPRIPVMSSVKSKTSKQLTKESTIKTRSNSKKVMKRIPSQNNSMNPPRNSNFEEFPKEENSFEVHPLPYEVEGNAGNRIIEKNQNVPDVPRAKVRTRIVPATNRPKKKRGRPRKKINSSLPGSSKQNVPPSLPVVSSVKTKTSKKMAKEFAIKTNTNNKKVISSQNNSMNPQRNPNFEEFPKEENSFEVAPLYQVYPPSNVIGNVSKYMVYPPNEVMENVPVCQMYSPHEVVENVPLYSVYPHNEIIINAPLYPVYHPNEVIDNGPFYPVYSPNKVIDKVPDCLDPRQPAMRKPASRAVNPAEVSEKAKRIFERLVVELANFTIPFRNVSVEEIAEPPNNPIEPEVEQDARPDEEIIQSTVDDFLESIPTTELDTYPSGVVRAKQLLRKLSQRLYLVMRNMKLAIMEIGRSNTMDEQLPHPDHFNNSINRLESVLSHIEIELTTVVECLRQHTLEKGLAFLTQCAYLEAHEEKFQTVLDNRTKYIAHKKLMVRPDATLAILRRRPVVHAKFISGAKKQVQFVSNLQRILNESKIMYPNWDEFMIH